MSTENKFEWTDELVGDFAIYWKVTAWEKKHLQDTINGFKRQSLQQQNTIPVGKKFEDDYIDLGNGRYRHKAQQNTIQKPPIGLLPLKIHRELRLTDINEAIDRFKVVGKEIPKYWIAEKESIEEWLGGRGSQILFETEDDWVVYEKDTYPIYKVDIFWHILQFAACDCGNFEDAKYFKSKEKANEYINLNKPVLSVNDVMKAAPLMGKYYEDGIKELAKSKIEGK